MNGLLVKAWRDHRRTLVGFGIGLVLAQAMYTAFYPSIRDSAGDLQAYMDRMPEAFRELFGTDFASPAGYLRSQLFGELGLILFLVVAIGAGARAIAGEEENRTLDALLSTPVRRREVLWSKAIAMVGLMVVLSVIGFVSVLVIGPVFDLRVGTADLAGASLMLALLSIAFGAIAFAIGAATGRRGSAIAVTAGLAVLMYIVNALGVTVDALEPVRPLSLFRWYTSPPLLSGELPLANVAVLALVAAVAFVLAQLAFDRRDLAS
ncbi:MAG TPA: ABC transporter permease subunit [Actinomycetota bacterium]